MNLGPMKGPDMAHELRVTLNDLYNGTVKKLAITRKKFDEKNQRLVNEKKVLELHIDPGMKDGTSGY